MVEADVLLAKISHTQDCLSRINEKIAGSIDNLNELDTQEIVVFNLQRAIQYTIDIAFHIVASEKIGLPSQLRDAFKILAKHNIIEEKLADKMIKMVGFRNVVVHEYDDIDSDILQAVVQYHLGDLEAFYTIIAEHYLNDNE